MTKNRATNTRLPKAPKASRKIVRFFSGARRSGFIHYGFTLVEILVTITIASILAFMTAPSMSESIQNSRTKKLSGEFRVALYLAQSEAIKRGIQVSISPLQTTGNEWQTGWNIFADPNGNGTKDIDEELIQTYSKPSNGLTLVSTNNVFATWLGFLPSGATQGDGGISGGFRICRSDVDITKSRSVTIQASGNIIVETGTTSCP